MEFVKGPQSDWRDRHPFKVAQYVLAKTGRRVHVDPGVARAVAMRGESVRGLWIAFEGVPYEFAADDFVAATAVDVPAAFEYEIHIDVSKGAAA